MRKIVLILAPFISLFINCKQEEEKPKVKYELPVEKVSKKQDTTRLLVCDLPIQMGNVLLYPMGELRVNNFRKNEYEAEKVDNNSFNVSSRMDDELTGYLKNVKFQQVASDSIYSLTDRTILIERITFVKDKNVLLYVLADNDTNQDGKVDTYDVKSLYISTLDGRLFTKLSPDVQELIDWNYVESNGKVYFRSLDDRNKNGAFDKYDGIHYFTVNLSNKWIVEEFDMFK